MLFVFLILSIALVQSVPVLEDVETEWSRFKIAYGKVYKNLNEEQLRRSVFNENYQFIKDHNERYIQGEIFHYARINKFADMTAQERKVALKGYKKSQMIDIDAQQFVPDPNVEVPDSFDWRTKNAITKIKDQASCGSCWAFSTTGSIETQYFLKTGKLVSLSEQNIVDCSTEGGNSGCDGGDMIPAFKYVYENDGIDSETGYPYKAVDQRCQYDVSDNVTSLKGYRTIKSGSEDDLKAAIAQAGSISVAIDASQMDFDFYAGGIYYNSNCNDGSNDPLIDLDHAVLAVGYGTEGDKDYWIVKNSWGLYWGNDGYIKMSRNRDNNCGIAAEASFPLMY